MRESIEVKGRRYLCEGRVVVKEASRTHFLAYVRGSGERWQVIGDKWGWRCNCPASTRCSHLVAVQLIALRPKRASS